MVKGKHIKDWKTTVIGLLLIGVASAYIYFVEDHDSIIFFGTLASGICLMFLPDKLFGGLGALIDKNKNKEL